MAKINNDEAYSQVTSVNNADTLIGSISTGPTHQFPISVMISALVSSTLFTDTLDEAETYQNDLLIGAHETDMIVMFAGQDRKTLGQVSSVDNTTGTITFNPIYGPFTGAITVLYKLA